MTQPSTNVTSLAEDAGAPPEWVGAEPGITTGPLTPALFRLAGPAILAKLLHAALALVNLLWVGRLGPAPSAAVTTSFFASWVLVSAVDLTALGILAHVARHMGARDRV